MLDFTRYLKEHYSKDLVGVEIGVHLGVNAFNMLSVLPNLKMLYLVDPYLDDRYGTGGYRKGVMLSHLKRFDDRITLVQNSSSVAVDSIPDGVDFVFIDGNHDYGFVKDDIGLYYPKIVMGGVLGGHDYSLRCRGVVHAVEEFMQNHDGCVLEFGDSTDWWFVKKSNDFGSKGVDNVGVFKFCPKCGFGWSWMKEFCPKCGTKLVKKNIKP